MTLKQAALEIAIGEIGKGEYGSNNAGPDIEKYLNGLAEPPSNWCAAFISWCYLEASFNRDIIKKNQIMPFQYTLSARNLFNQFKKKAINLGESLEGFVELTKEPEPGDLIFFWRESPKSWMGHVGIIEKLDDKLIYTIEGNKGEFPALVKRCYYSKNPKSIPTLLGFGKVLI